MQYHSVCGVLKLSEALHLFSNVYLFVYLCQSYKNF